MSYKYPPNSQPLPGYTIQQGIGRGAFGEVYYAVSEAGKDVALKFVQNQIEVELRGVRECLNLDHPNLVRLYDVKKSDQGESWVVMEYCEGESLEEAIARYPDGMPIDEAMRWMRGLCAGVAYLHDQNIVHRDLKPSHVFMENGVVKIGDYGLAKFVTVSRRSGNTEGIGTVFYSAPEMAEGRYGNEIDLYALGVIFYEMLAGDVPFDGQSAAEVLMKHLTAPPDVSRFPSPYREILWKLLEKKPEYRYRSVAELTAALDAPLTVRPPLDIRGVRRFAASLFHRFRVRDKAKAIARTAWNHKQATVGLMILVGIAFGIGIAIGDANNWVLQQRYRNQQLLYTQYATNMNSVRSVAIKRNDGSETTVQLGEIARMEHVRVTGSTTRNGRRRSERYEMTHILLNDSQARLNGVSDREVLEGLWDAGFCPAIDIHVDPEKAAAVGVKTDDVIAALNLIARRSTIRAQQVDLLTDRNRIIVRFGRLRGRNNPQGGTAFFLMDPMAFLSAKVVPGQGSSQAAVATGGIPISEIATIRIAAGNPVWR